MQIDRRGKLSSVVSGYRLLITPNAQIDLVSAIRDHALHAFSQSNDPESHPDALAADAKKLQDLRKSATLSSEGSDGSSLPSGMLDRMILYVHVPSCTKEKAETIHYSYHAQLVFILTKFPVDVGYSRVLLLRIAWLIRTPHHALHIAACPLHNVDRHLLPLVPSLCNSYTARSAAGIQPVRRSTHHLCNRDSRLAV